MGVTRYTRNLGSVWCPGCGFVSELLSSDHVRSARSQLRGFLGCNGCPECPADLVLTRTCVELERSPVAGLH